MPASSSSRGRHRRSRHSVKPAYVSAATLAAFTVSGLNVPSAIGQVRSGVQPSLGHATLRGEQRQATKDPHATELRVQERLRARETARASREGTVRTAQLAAVATATRRAAAARARNTWVVPVLGYRLTSGFGDVSALWSSAHTGQDFAAPEGTPVHAAGRGRIIFASWDGSYGLKIAIQHFDGTVTWYGHLSSALRTSGEVQAGDVIGRVGSTGNSTGPHLHLEVRPGDGSPVPPLPWLRAHGVHV